MCILQRDKGFFCSLFSIIPFHQFNYPYIRLFLVHNQPIFVHLNKQILPSFDVSPSSGESCTAHELCVLRNITFEQKLPEVKNVTFHSFHLCKWNISHVTNMVTIGQTDVKNRMVRGPSSHTSHIHHPPPPHPSQFDGLFASRKRIHIKCNSCWKYHAWHTSHTKEMSAVKSHVDAHGGNLSDTFTLRHDF
jgi:hypothetical protein